MLSSIPKLNRTAKEIILLQKKTSVLYFTTKEDALPLLYYKQNNQTFNFKTKFVNFSGTGIWPENRLRNGIWAKFGLENGIYTPFPPPPPSTSGPS